MGGRPEIREQIVNFLKNYINDDRVLQSSCGVNSAMWFEDDLNEALGITSSVREAFVERVDQHFRGAFEVPDAYTRALRYRQSLREGQCQCP